MSSALGKEWINPVLPMMVVANPIPECRAQKTPLCLVKITPIPATLLLPCLLVYIPQVASSSFMTAYPKAVWITHTIIQLGSEPRAFYKIKQAPANSVNLLVQAIPGSPLRWVPLLGPQWGLQGGPWNAFPSLPLWSSSFSPFHLFQPLGHLHEDMRLSSNQEAFMAWPLLGCPELDTRAFH